MAHLRHAPTACSDQEGIPPELYRAGAGERRPVSLLIFILWCGSLISAAGADQAIEPVTPNASPEARALLELLHQTSGKYTFTGQHNFPNTKDRNSQFAARYFGKRPVIWSTDWGFAKQGDTDSYLARPDIVQEAKRQHQMGSLVTICWHAVPPTANEPVTFRPEPGAASNALASVQGRLLDEQFKDLLTPGTELHKRWLAQVDAIATHLKELQKAHVPILWRPYHEMNGDWFWWGGRQGQYSTRALYRQLFDRLVKYHKLDNLIWVWSVDRPNKPEMQFSNYYPGDEYLDVLALDVYGSDFKLSYYDDLVALSKGKPVVLGEVGNPPGLDVTAESTQVGLLGGLGRDGAEHLEETICGFGPGPPHTQPGRSGLLRGHSPVSPGLRPHPAAGRDAASRLFGDLDSE